MTPATGDPIRTAQKLSAQPLPKRFYKEATVAARPEGHWLHLDGKPAHTPARAPLAVPVAGLATRLVEEWNAQDGTIDPARMPYTRLVNTAIDGVRGREAEVLDDVLSYAQSDLLCYRAESQEGLAERQRELWDPVVDWLAEAAGVRPVLIAGVMHQAQPAGLTGAMRGFLPDDDAFALAALHVITTLTGSAILALAVRRGRLSGGEAWMLAHLDEDWQMALWGKDEDALRRRARREGEMNAAAEILALLSGGSEA